MVEYEKTDPELGKLVRDHLKDANLLNLERDQKLTSREKIDKLTEVFGDVLDALEVNRLDGNLIETPKRLAKMYVNDLFCGLDWSKFPKCTTVDNQFVGYKNFVLVKDIKIQSCCSHHFMPFFGIKGMVDGGVVFGPGCNIAYIPNKKVLGLSKLSRVVDFLARRPNTQETLTAQIAKTVAFITSSCDVAVSINASHTCQSLRGVGDPTANTETLFCIGRFEEDPQLRNEFLDCLKK